MRSYYTAIIFLNIFAMLIVQIGVSKSNTLDKERKRSFKSLFNVIIVASLCEWAGNMLQGSGPDTRSLHALVKILEFSIAPFTAFIVSFIIEKRHSRFILFLLSLHACIELISAFWPFIYSIDAESNYTHGPFYWIYISMYIFSFFYCFWIVSRNVRKYQYNGIGFFLLIILFMVCGIILQLVNSSIKVDYIVLGMSSIMLYIFTLEMVNQTDELTELMNRRGYENCISHLDHKCEFLFFDVDKFKQANDTYGHKYGDEVLRTIGITIRTVYAKYGKCFRYGGDEFCVILDADSSKLSALNEQFEEMIIKVKESDPRFPSVSLGQSFCDPESESIQDIFNDAEKMMYQLKKERKAKAHEICQN